MMKLVLFGIIVILFSLIGSIHGISGNYPLNPYGGYYYCTILGENEYCKKICRIHGVRYGYCYDSACWCETLKDEDVSVWNAVKKHCKNPYL
uniref:Lipolysis-activating peptide 1-alpha chain n=1 Tax=Buthus occitanus tunetanus TaxID=6871 RepID=LV1A_BUTOC|nr:RecName: Full=Lipolysis-activating peptide 1-alpha chain; Short=BotLVP1-alpha; Short=LVP1-alpha; Contains: RecName: Full=Neurotoxin BmKBTx-like; Flags: Precursor [Buthus occitanus tunetanus]